MLVWLVGCIIVVQTKTDTGTVPTDPGTTPVTSVTTSTTTATTTTTTTTTLGSPPNVLVIFADDVGTDKVGAYGEHPEAPPTPTIDALAQNGVLFRNAWAHGTSSATRAGLLTGRHARRTGLGRSYRPDEGYELPLAEVLLPEMLVDYATSQVGKWHLSSYNSATGSAHPGAQGFDWYAGSMANLGNASVEPSPRGDYFNWEKNDNGVFSWVNTYATTDQVDDAVARIGVMPEPWLLMVAFNAAHEPFHAPPAALWSGDPSTTDVVEQVHGMIEALDTELGRLMAVVDLSDTLVVFIGDNGTTSEAILPPLDPTHGIDSMYEGGVNVPLLIAGAGVGAPGSESPALVHAIDVFPTVAELAGINLQTVLDADGVPVVIDGTSLVPLLTDPTAPHRDVVYTERFATNNPARIDQRAVRNERFKLLVDVVAGTESLYDLDGRHDDGPNLLDAPLTADAQAGLDALRLALADIEALLLP